MHQMKHFVVVILLALAFQSSVAQQTAKVGDWSELLNVDCNGGLHILSNHDLVHAGVDISLIRKFFDIVREKIRAAAACHCPSLTNSELDQGFFPGFDTLLRILGPYGSLPLPTCQSQSNRFAFDFTRPGEVDAALPNTCTWGRWQSEGKCTLQYDMSKLGIQLRLAVGKCPVHSGFPFISLTCNGPLCQDFGKPCASSADCLSGGECQEIASSATADVSSDFKKLLDELNLFKANDSCSAFDQANVGKKVLDSLVSFWGYFLGNSVNVDGLRFCGFDRIKIDNHPIDELFGNCTVNKKNFTCSPNLQTWNGIIGTQTDVFSASRMNGASFQQFQQDTSVATVFPLAHLSCSSRFSVFLKGSARIRVYFPNVHDVINKAGSIAQELQQCRSAGFPEAQFVTRFLPYLPAMLLHRFTTHPLRPLMPALPDLYSKIFDVNEVVDQLDSSQTDCTYDNWINNGVCKFAYTGLADLLGKDITIRAQIVRCAPDIYAIPEITLDCVGADCDCVFNPWANFQPCSADSDCGAGGTCHKIQNVNSLIPNFLWAGNLKDNDGGRQVELFLQDIDNFIGSDLNRFRTIALQNISTLMVWDPALQQNVNFPMNRVVRSTISSLGFNNYKLALSISPPTPEGLSGSSSDNIGAWLIANVLQGPMSGLFIGQFVFSSFSGSAQFWWCALDSQWVMDVDADSDPICPTPDTCAGSVKTITDLINAVRNVTGQSQVASARGFCSICAENAFDDSAWAESHKPVKTGSGIILPGLTKFVPQPGEAPADSNPAALYATVQAVLAINIQAIPDINAFKTKFAEQAAAALGIDQSRIEVVLVAPASIMVKFVIKPPPPGSSALPAPAAAQSFADQAGDPNSPLRDPSNDVTSTTTAVTSIASSTSDPSASDDDLIPGVGDRSFFIGVGIAVGVALLALMAFVALRKRRSSGIKLDVQLATSSSVESFGTPQTATQPAPPSAPSPRKPPAPAGPVPPLPAGWVECTTDDGIAYYYNNSTGASVWERPSSTS